MRILFTGSSSFTGYWFIGELVAAGHEVVATFRGAAGSYEGARKQRVDALAEVTDCRFGIEFGDPAFLDLIAGGPWDLLCHHAAEVGNYRSPDFDVLGAVAANTRDCRSVFGRLVSAGCSRVIATGSVFEQGEGAGDLPLRAFSPYGLSKGLSYQLLEHHAAEAGVALSKFVIPNPFGPLEEPRFTTYLARTWLRGDVATVATPAYVRDNIHVSLLARAYAAFAAGEVGGSLFRPSGYVGPQGWFAGLVAAELGPRLGLKCELALAQQSEFPEPRVRINTDPLDAAALGWDEATAWESLAEYYRSAFGGD